MKKIIEKFKNNKRLLVYFAIVGGLAVLGLTFFGISQYEKAKYKASTVALTSAQTELNKLADKEETNFIKDKKAWYQDIVDNFTVVNDHNANSYKGTAIPAYLFTTFALISFGLCLKDADKIKSKEDQD